MDQNADTKPKDAGLLVMLLLVIVGTLIMAWVAEQKQNPEIPITVEAQPAQIN